MTDPTAEITRLAAARLADLDSDLPTAAEMILTGQGPPRRRGLDANLTLTLASFILGLAQFGWSVYKDHRQERKESAREVLIRRLRVDFGRPRTRPAAANPPWSTTWAK